MGEKVIGPYIRAQAVALYQCGLNTTEIFKELQVWRCCVRNAIVKYEDQRTFIDFPRSGRPKKISERGSRESSVSRDCSSLFEKIGLQICGED